MRRARVPVWLALVAGGCAGRDPAPVLIDAVHAMDVAPSCGLARQSFCNPASGTGCNAGEKCAWRYYPDLARGIPACIPDGTRPVGESCTTSVTDDSSCGPVTTDDCAAGSHCDAGLCRRICDPGVSPTSCSDGAICTFVGDAFVIDGRHLFGVCKPPVRRGQAPHAQLATQLQPSHAVIPRWSKVRTWSLTPVGLRSVSSSVATIARCYSRMVQVAYVEPDPGRALRFTR